MFDDRLFDTILSEMISAVGPDVRTDEGSLMYNACAKIAMKLEEVYGDMDEINDNLLPDTQDDSHLIRYGKERGLEYAYATNPIVKGVFLQTIDIGERFTCNDYTYIVTELISQFNYKLQCETEGTAANANFGQLDAIDYIDDYKGGQITELLVAGVDDEDIEEYRQKVIDTFKSTAFGGNKTDYRNYINNIDGVGGCKPMRRAEDSSWVNIYIISADYGIPSQVLVNTVQTAVDPEQSHGEGDGMAPICHEVQIIGVTGVEINIETKITFDEGYSAQTSETQIKEAIENYLLELRQKWQENELESTIVRLAQIESKILTVEGVLDVSGTTINGESSNLSVAYTSIPVLGGVVIV